MALSFCSEPQPECCGFFFGDDRSYSACHKSRRPGRPRLGGRRKLAKTVRLLPGWAGQGTRPYANTVERL